MRLPLAAEVAIDANDRFHAVIDAHAALVDQVTAAVDDERAEVATARAFDISDARGESLLVAPVWVAVAWCDLAFSNQKRKATTKAISVKAVSVGSSSLARLHLVVSCEGSGKLPGPIAFLRIQVFLFSGVPPEERDGDGGCRSSDDQPEFAKQASVRFRIPHLDYSIK